ncbi:hypothetical protein BDV98DRAFT_568076 [Pterulicium gracile]|uniref:Uncharacterized protein n=1 Tax=Pterulicium gracile TaxID=1884261 RepID=A0A5C3QST4_9AGAR|nr:hypothetical protein BDV98DRAFT_568076 [Pterula gracilis]
MASNVASTSSNASSSSTTTIDTGSGQQAGPLPIKRGEIGFAEVEVEVQQDQSSGSGSTPTLQEIAVPLPARHPADRDAAPPTVTTTPPPPETPPTSVASSSSSTHSKKKIIVYLKSKQVSKLNVHLTTFLLFLAQLFVLGGSVVAWIFTTRASHNSKFLGGTGDEDDATSGLGPSMTILIHVVFGIGALAQIIMLERRLFRLRVERYAQNHPGQILPTSRRRHGLGTRGLAVAPWNRPPIPTYAAALAESGAGTGDVEDHIIAQPPPPAYGNTRGSVFLLSGYLNPTLVAQRPISERSEVSEVERGGSRPLSYRSRDGDWEEIVDADRARRLEDTLARLERPASRARTEDASDRV